MRIGGLSLYPNSIASTRLRLAHLAPQLKERGHELALSSWLSDARVDQWLRGGWRRLPAASESLLGMNFRDALDRASVVIVQREYLPISSLAIEKRARRAKVLIWDIDDALWESTGELRHRFRGGSGKYEWLARNADEIWAGNETIADWCEQFRPRSLQIVPTTTPIPNFLAPVDQTPRLVWVGTPSTGPFLEKILHILADNLVDWELDIVGARVRIPHGVRARQHEWSEATEYSVLQGAWAGLYPIDVAHPLGHGKSGFKAVLFGAYGLPTIATRTRTNASIIREDETGFLCETADEWTASLKLLAHRSIRDQMGINARNHVLRHFNPTTWSTRLVNRLEVMNESLKR